jgi:hypothetical protein
VKRLVICCDGTWNQPDQVSPTNVVKVALSLRDRDRAGVVQRIFYNSGVGTGRFDRLRGGALGFGLSRHVRECYRFLVENYEPGDELYFFGFSRGAFTARSAAGLVRNSGILRREHQNRIGDAFTLYRGRDPLSHPRGTRATLFRRSFSYEPRVHFMGVWDTVGALGVPILGPGWANVLGRRWQFHDTDLSTRVDLAYQALAIDEDRGPSCRRSGTGRRAPAPRCSSRSGSRASTRTSAAATPTRRSPSCPCCGWPTGRRRPGWSSRTATSRGGRPRTPPPSRRRGRRAATSPPTAPRR